MRGWPAALIVLCAATAACRTGPQEIPDRPWKAADGSAGTALQPAAADGQPARSTKPLEGKLRTPYTLKAGKKASLALYALEGEAVVPAWAAPAADPGAVRDDDLLTTWSCSRVDPARPCAISIVLPEEAQVHVIRIFPGAGTSREEFRAHARPKVIGVHTDAGWAEARIKRGWDFRHILLPAGNVTRTVTLEVLKVRPGRVDAGLHLAEIEIIGVSGEARAPLEIEPRAAAVHLDGPAWSAGEGESAHVAAAGFIDLVDGKGSARRLLRGTGLVGEPGDRFFLVENLTAVDCPQGGPPSLSGSFTLVDTRTRIYWDVGGLGGMLGTVYRHPEGIGFATAGREGPANAAAVIVEGHMFRMPEDRAGAFTSGAEIEAWGFAADPAPCCSSVAPWPAGCKTAPASRVQEILSGLEGGGWEAAAEREGWLLCPLEKKARLLVLPGPGCGAAPAALLTLDAKGGVRDTRLADLVRLGASFPSRRLVEVVDGDGPSILRVGPEGQLQTVYAATGLSLLPPASCPCP